MGKSRTSDGLYAKEEIKAIRRNVIFKSLKGFKERMDHIQCVKIRNNF